MNSKSSRSQWQPGGPAMGIAGEVWARPRSSGPPQGSRSPLTAPEHSTWAYWHCLIFQFINKSCKSGLLCEIL